MASSFDLFGTLQAIKAELTRQKAKLDAVEYLNYNVPKSDPSGRLQSNLSTTNASCKVVTGYVIDSLATYGWYSVQLDDSTYIPCGLLCDNSESAVGVKRIGALTPGSRVFVVLNKAYETGTILGVIPGYILEESRGVRDYISQASPTSMGNEGFFAKYIAQNSPRILSFTKSAPVDETSVGEWGRITENGTSLFIDPFMAYLRADENCGFWAFWHDQLARMHGHNLQIRSRAFDLYSFNDEDELSVITGFSPYLWESLGGFTRRQLSKERSEEACQTNQSEFAAHDLAVNGQVPFHRLRRFDGFLGQGFRQQLQLPPQNDQSKIYSIGDTVKAPAVWEEHLALDGNYHMVSSQGIFIAHIPTSISPEQIRSPEDSRGDSRENGYGPAGIGGTTQIIKTGPGLTTTLPGTGSALSADDELAYGLKWRAGHPFHYHNKDWANHQETVSEKIDGYRKLADNHYLEKPLPDQLLVDHRETKAEYHPTLSFVSILRDGTVVIAGPAGEEIRMGGGSVEISCPGDIQLRPGRNLVTLAGGDAVTRAKGSVEISASEQDVRIKAQRNMQILGGNAGSGGVLIESKSTGSAFDYTKTGSEVISNGLVLKSNSTVACIGRDVYLRSGTKDSDTGAIIVDAAKGNGLIVTTASQTLNYNKSDILDYFGTPDNIKSFNYFSNKNTILAGGFQCFDGNGGVLTGSLLTKGNVVALGGTFAASNTTGYVGKLRSEDENKNRKIFENLKDEIKEKSDEGEKYYKQIVADTKHTDNQIGNSRVLSTMGFSFRTTTQYRANSFVLFESRWAQRARMRGETMSTWKEAPVKAIGESTYPYPGAEAWLNTSYRKVNTSLYTKAETGTGFGPKSAGSVYEQDPTGSAVEKVKADGQYPVIS
jgi:hypothetical protein